jgi:hypothetical protein
VVHFIQPAVNTAVLTGGHSGPTCTPSGGSFATCPATVTWDTPLADANYKYSCTGVGATDARMYIQGGVPSSGASVGVTIVTGGSSSSNFSDVLCIAKHN